ncbi:protein kinase-like protein [Herbihabitans rhizosphaerae]|uniref:non-specific serine/threonine protein kinase n=1 Tax=Herbihabitans rhizosphaerae TaxID=1872711 RepID=A0A4Q7L515_9PSEU|nr:class III lanthionine synthetase LanKC [Herbihabitans rhizosphaerae]RZS44306.1 protein kinase-like protein [Herbihabitans rhizosphaerae]
MDQMLSLYCVADESFFDRPDRMDDGATRFAVADRPAPTNWGRGESDLWVGLASPHGRPPAQGWKIHVSVTREDAERCLDIVWDYCAANDLDFKFLRSADAMLILNAKYARRGSSGKLVTLYPRDDAQLAHALTELDARLSGLSGPYVLGDLRIGKGPLYVRYGAFDEMWCHDGGDDPALAIADPRGELIPDRREPVFTVPEWAAIPDVLRPHIEARTKASAADFPYRVTEALHFSNGGGVYVGEDSSGTKVVLREARPHAGLDRHGTDAVQRLRREHDTLARLSGLDCVPHVLDHRVVQDHHFLVEEFIEGTTLLRAIQTRSPSLAPGASSEEITGQIRDYRDWAVDVLERISTALRAVHSRGVRFGDLHPANILIQPDGEVVFVDFEFAADLTDDVPPGLGAPGFIAPPGLTGAEVDLYALNCLRVYLFTMLTPLTDLDRAKAVTLAAEACRDNAMPTEFADRFVAATHPAGATPAPDRAADLFADPSWPTIRDSLVAGILDSATPDRTDRLFPGSPQQFRTGGFDLAHGAAGVLLALHRVGAPVADEHVGWMVRAVQDAPTRPALGLYNGPHGVAAVLDELGRRDEALDVLDVARAFDRLPASDTLYGGHAGRAVNLLHFARATGDQELRAAALELGHDVAARAASGTWPTGRGLLRGPSGVALLLLHLHEETGDARYLDLAWQGLRRDLDNGETLPDGTFQLRAEHRAVPYLDGGGSGVALVLHEFTRHHRDAETDRIMAGIRRGCAVPFVYLPGLFSGRAGFVATLARLGTDRDVLREHVHRFGSHALSRNGNLVFPGDQLLRLSLDLATGSAGILLALHAVFDGTRAVLPYLETRSPTPVRTREGGEQHDQHPRPAGP